MIKGNKSLLSILWGIHCFFEWRFWKTRYPSVFACYSFNFCHERKW